MAIDRAARTVVPSDGRTLAYDKLLIATGTRVRKLACSRRGPAGNSLSP